MIIKILTTVDWIMWDYHGLQTNLNYPVSKPKQTMLTQAKLKIRIISNRIQT